MRAALLNLARVERASFGAVSNDTRRRLQQYGVDSVALETYLSITGV
jgi:hypothetical protein